MKNNILAIGIDNYRNINRLNNCVKDLENTIDVLLDKYEFDRTDVKRIYNADATTESILFSLEDYLSKQSSGDNIIILFSGHGDFDTKLDLGYFLPVECYLDNKSTYIPNTTFFNYIKAFEYRHVILISDTCFSGSLFPLTRSIQAPSERLFEIPSKWALTSGRIEKVMDGIPGENSPFAEAIIKSLKDNSNPFFSISELTRYVISDVASKQNQIPRGAPLQILGDKGGEFFFKLKTQSKGITRSTTAKGNDDVLENLLAEFYKLTEKLEDAENQNKPATIRRLNEEMDFVKKAIDRELIKILELGKNEVKNSNQLQNLLGTDIDVLIKNINSLSKEKIDLVKRQQFEAAAAARDKEKTLAKEIRPLVQSKKSDLLTSLNNAEDSIEQNFGILSLLADIIPSSNRTSFSKLIDDEFTEMLFLKLSKNKQFITPFRFDEKLRHLQEEFIPNVFNQLTSKDENASVYYYKSGDIVTKETSSSGERKAVTFKRKSSPPTHRTTRPPK
ncbi:MAG: caspase family protein [Prolixibacteraceae bacterium]|nr:caspase family protein [Prolixibacteraceae bacterium]